MMVQYFLYTTNLTKELTDVQMGLLSLVRPPVKVEGTRRSTNSVNLAVI